MGMEHFLSWGKNEKLSLYLIGLRNFWVLWFWKSLHVLMLFLLYFSFFFFPLLYFSRLKLSWLVE